MARNFLNRMWKDEVISKQEKEFHPAGKCPECGKHVENIGMKRDSDSLHVPALLVCPEDGQFEGDWVTA